MTRIIKVAHNRTKFNNIGFYLREMVPGGDQGADSEGFKLGMGTGRAIRLVPLLLSMLRKTYELGRGGVVSAIAETPAYVGGFAW